MMTIAAVVLIVVLMIPPICAITYITYNYVKYRSLKHTLDDGVPHDCGLKVDDQLTVVILTLNERIETVLEAVRRALNLRWPGDVKVIVVSDDDEEYVSRLRSMLSSLSTKVSVLRRPIRVNGRSGAFNFALGFIEGGLMLTMDVDSDIDPDFPLRAYCQMIKNNHSAVAGRWYGYNRDTLVSKAVTGAMWPAVSTIEGGRYVREMPALVTGTGTVFRVDALKKIGGWEGGGVQDDVYIWLKLISNGYTVGFIDYPSVGVENPRTYSVFRFQQYKWAYGAADALRRAWGFFTRSRLPLRVKVDAILLLLQYAAPAFFIISSILVGALALALGNQIGLYTLPLLVTYGLLALVYGYLSLKDYSDRLDIYSAGRSSAMLTAMSIGLLVSFTRGITGLGFRKWGVTPKGGLARIKDIPLETVMLIALTTLAILNILKGYWAPALWTLAADASFIYVHLRFIDDIL